MKSDRLQPLKRCCAAVTRSSEAGFSALELIVILVIIAAVVGVGVPTLHSRARVTVLDSNMRSLAALVQEGALDGLSGEYRQSGAGRPDKHLSTYLEETLRAEGEGGYVNPVAGVNNGRMVLNTPSIPAELLRTPPAVLITNAPDHQYGYGPSATEAGDPTLAGALIVAFDPRTNIVDVYYIDEDGRQSADVLHVPLA